MEKFTPRPKAAPTPRPTPSPSAQPTPQAQPQEEASSAPAAVASAPAARSAAPAASASEDDAYSAQVRAYLDSIKHYPTSKEARLQHPRGVVEVWFVLDRSGGMKEAGVETSSGSLILDGAALSLVRSASYPAFQPDAFKGQTTHRFTVHLNYTLT
jgi:protein TonB